MTKMIKISDSRSLLTVLIMIRQTLFFHFLFTIRSKFDRPPVPTTVFKAYTPKKSMS